MTVKSIPSDLPTRVQLALGHKLSPSDLKDFEQALFFHALGQRRSSEADKKAFAAELLEEAGNVGYDEAGNLVKTLGGGDIKVLKPAD